MRRATCLLVTATLTLCSISLWANPFQSDCFSSDGSMIAGNDSHCTVAVWDTSSGERIASLYEPFDFSRTPPGQRRIICFAMVFGFSHDGKLLATQRRGEPIILWDLQNRREIASLGGDFGCGDFRMNSAEFSANSRFIFAVGCEAVQNRIQRDALTVWDVASHKVVLNARADADRAFRKVGFSPDGKTLMAMEGPRRGTKIPDTIKLWDVERGEELATLAGRSAYFSPNGRFLLFQNREFENVLWDIRAGELRVLKKRVRAVQSKSK
jgi:WD40 repeat protein